MANPDQPVPIIGVVKDEITDDIQGEIRPYDG
jgi:hypothetical protein